MHSLTPGPAILTAITGLLTVLVRPWAQCPNRAWQLDENDHVEAFPFGGGRDPCTLQQPLFVMSQRGMREKSRAQAVSHFEKVARRRVLWRKFRAIGRLAGRLSTRRAEAAERAYAPGGAGQAQAQAEFEEAWRSL